MTSLPLKPRSVSLAASTLMMSLHVAPFSKFRALVPVMRAMMCYLSMISVKESGPVDRSHRLTDLEHEICGVVCRQDCIVEIGKGHEIGAIGVAVDVDSNGCVAGDLLELQVA